MKSKQTIKVIKKKELETAHGPPAEVEKEKSTSTKEMSSIVTNWVKEFQANRRAKSSQFLNPIHLTSPPVI